MGKKLFKLAKIVGGVFVFSEICGIMGEAQMLRAMYQNWPDVVDDAIGTLTDDTEISNAGLKGYRRFKSKAVGNIAKVLTEE